MSYRWLSILLWRKQGECLGLDPEAVYWYPNSSNVLTIPGNDRVANICCHCSNYEIGHQRRDIRLIVCPLPTNIGFEGTGYMCVLCRERENCCPIENRVHLVSILPIHQLQPTSEFLDVNSCRDASVSFVQV